MIARPTSCLSLLPLAILMLASAESVSAQDAPVRRLACGAYEAVPSAVGAEGRPSRLSIQKNGRLLVNVSDWAITALSCEDINGDSTLELLVSTHSGGAHCCATLHIWSLGLSPKPLLDYEGGNATDLEVRDLDGDGRKELLLGDDGLAYFDDLSYASSPASIPLVACFAVDRFQDCTTRFPEILRARMKIYSGRLHPPTSEDDEQEVRGAALGVLAIAVLLGEEEQSLSAVLQTTRSDVVMKWLERLRPRVRDWAAARGRKLKKEK
ncbi:MAG TPA: VCBS repeat-containing protein [Vicinamibacterales bacterium]|jgi:hypothetical protein